MIDTTATEPVPGSLLPAARILRFCLIMIVVLASGALAFNLMGGFYTPISSKSLPPDASPNHRVQNFQPNDSSSDVMHPQPSVQNFQPNVSTSEVSDCACDKAPSTNDLRPIEFSSDLPISSVVTADFANFANVVEILMLEII